MPQIRKGTVALTNGSAVVRAVHSSTLRNIEWSATVANRVGTFQVGETVTGVASGFSGVVGPLTTLSVLSILVASGNPMTGEQVLGVTSNAVCNLVNPTEYEFLVGTTYDLTPSLMSVRVLSWDRRTKTLRYLPVVDLGVDPGDGEQVLVGGFERALMTSPGPSVRWLTGPADEMLTLAGLYPPIFNKRGEAVTYDLANILSDDELELTLPYGGDDAENVEYVVSTDFDDDTGMAYLAGQDVDAPALWNRNIRRLKLLLGNVLGLFQTPPSYSGNERKVARINAAGSALELVEPVLLADPAGADSVRQVLKKSLDIEGGSSRWLRLLALGHDAGVPPVFGGRLTIEPGVSDVRTGFVHIETFVDGFGDGQLRVYQKGQPSIMQFRLRDGLLVVPNLSVTGSFQESISMGRYETVYDRYNGAFDGRRFNVTGVVGAFTNGEIASFSPSGAIARVWNVTGGVMVVSLADGSEEPLALDTVTGRTSGATATVGTPAVLGLASATSNTLTPSVSPNWTPNQWQDGYGIEIMSGKGAGEPVRLIASNTASAVTIAETWVEQPNNTSTFRIVDMLEDRRVTKRLYGGEAQKVAGDQTVTSGTEAAVTGLAAIEAAGVDGRREYDVDGFITVSSTTEQTITVRLRVGVNGSVADTVRGIWYGTVLANGLITIPFRRKLQLNPGQKLTVTAAGAATFVAKGDVDGAHCYLRYSENTRRSR